MENPLDYLTAYRATQIPRYEGEDVEAYVLDNIHKQKTFWGAVVNVLNDFESSDCVVEMRYASEPESHVICLDLICWAGRKSKKDIRQSLVEFVENLLPSDYAWEYLPQSDVFMVGMKNQGWFISRVIRRLEFVDLPVSNPFDAEDDTLDVFEMSRTIPTAETTEEDFAVSPHCVPTAAPIEVHERSQIQVFGQMQKLAPNVISFALSAIDSGFMKNFRPIVLFWRNFLRLNRPYTAESDLPGSNQPAEALSGALDGFLSPDSQLCYVRVSVAADNPHRAKSTAQQLASRMGGLRAYRVRTSTQQLPLNEMANLWNEVPSNRWDAQHLLQCYQNTWKSLKRQGISSPDPVKSREFHVHLKLLSCMPYIYTMEEVQSVLEMPRADRDGLPGFDTTLLPPFIGTVNKPCPVVVEDKIARAPQSQLRIGIARPGCSAASQPEAEAKHDNRLIDQYRDAHWHTMDIRNLTKHALIVGSTGSGKTMCTLFLVRELARLKIPFLIIEPVKTEYYDVLKSFKTDIPITRLRFEGDATGKRSSDFLAFDPMRIPSGISAARHASYLKACFESAFPLEPLPALLLEGGILAYYTDKVYGCGYKLLEVADSGPAKLHEKSGSPIPSLGHFISFFLNFYLESAFTDKKVTKTKHQMEMLTEFKQLFRRRFDILMNGMVGEAVKAATQKFKEDDTSYETLLPYLSSNTIIELDAIPDADQKGLLMAFIMTYLFERRQGDDFGARNPGHAQKLHASAEAIDGLKHVLVIEEAHRILTKPESNNIVQTGKSKAVSLFVDMLAEIRALGQGMIIVEQIPTKIIPEAVKNTNLKIMLRLTSKDDREYLGEAMSFTEQQKQFVTKLRAKGGHGVDMVIFEEGVDQPLMLNLPLPHEKIGNWLYNEFFK